MSAVSDFVDTIMLHYPPFRWDEHQEQAWTAAMVLELGDFDPAVLKKAAQHMVRTRKDHRTPLVSECITACIDARRWLNAEKSATTLPMQGHSAKPFFHEKLADDLIMSADGRQAAKEGWIGTLHIFIARNGRMPQGREIADCKRQAKEFDDAYAQCLRGGWPQAQSLASLGAAMLKNRKQLTEKVLGK